MTPSPVVLARLRAAAVAPPEWPVVTSLSDLAAEGVIEAIVRLADLSAAGMESELAGVWSEVAAAAPEETAAALLEAPEASARAAARSLALSAGGAGPRRVAVASPLTKEGEAGGPDARRAADIGTLLRAPVAAPLERLAAPARLAGAGPPAAIGVEDGARTPATTASCASRSAAPRAARSPASPRKGADASSAATATWKRRRIWVRWASTTRRS